MTHKYNDTGQTKGKMKKKERKKKGKKLFTFHREGRDASYPSLITFNRDR